MSTKTAFVMMQISDKNPKLDDILDTIKRACEEKDINAKRADDFDHSGKITNLLLAAIVQSELLIADLTYDRPNVYYELGFAHGLGRPVILLARAGTELHFDIKDYNTIFYHNFKALHSKLSYRLSKLLLSDSASMLEQNNITICSNCKYFYNLEPDSPRSDIWYHHFCTASPRPKKNDPFDGKLKPYGKNDLGNEIFYNKKEKEFQYCRDINDGHCPKFELISR